LLCKYLLRQIELRLHMLFFAPSIYFFFSKLKRTLFWWRKGRTFHSSVHTANGNNSKCK